MVALIFCLAISSGMCVLGRMKHPKHGKLFYVQNSWSAAGGFWIRESDLAYILRQDDSFIYSNFDGFPAQALDYLF